MAESNTLIMEDNMDYKNYNIKPMGTFSMYEIKNKGSGPAPKALRGYFTSKQFAMNAIDSHVAKGKKNAKTEGSIGG